MMKTMIGLSAARACDAVNGVATASSIARAVDRRGMKVLRMKPSVALIYGRTTATGNRRQILSAFRHGRRRHGRRTWTEAIRHVSESRYRRQSRRMQIVRSDGRNER